MKSVYLIAVFIVAGIIQGKSTTWDEAWQDSIIFKADNFIYGKIKECKKNSIKVEIIRAYGEKISSKTIIIDSYNDLHRSSWSSAAAYEEWFSTYLENNMEIFFFVQKNKLGKNYSIPTPTSGYAPIVKGKVYATYRHSYHQALVSPEIYEKTMLAIFNHYHLLPYDRSFIDSFVFQQLIQKPASFEPDEVEIFFQQHVAMECIYHLQLQPKYALLIPFFYDTSNIHNQISAARALVAFNTIECKNELINVISDTISSNFLKVMCIWSLQRFNPIELKPILEEEYKTASDDYVSFGGNIMDPRIGTSMPSVKSALALLIENL